MFKNLFIKHKKEIINILIILSFLLLTYVSVCLIWYNGKLYFIQEDSFFHFARVEELIKSDKIFPIYAFNSFNFAGSAVTLMYPYLLIYPLAILLKLTNSMKLSLLLFYMLGTLLTLLISYFSSIKFSKSKLTSYIFSLIYAFSGQFMAMYFYSHVTDVGVYLSAIFLPLVIFGFIYLMTYGNWVMLSIGMSLVFFSNIISVPCISVLLIILLLLNYKVINFNKINSIIKASLLTLITTACQWIPMFKLSAYNNLDIPSDTKVFHIGLRAELMSSLHNNFAAGCQSFSIFSLISIILGLIFYKTFSKSLKKLYLYSIIIIIFCSKIFPWFLLSKISVIRHIQTTGRMLVVPQLVLEFILAFMISKLIQNKKLFIKIIGLFIVILCISLTQLESQHRYITQGNNITTSYFKKASNIHQIVTKNRWLAFSNNIRRIKYVSVRMGNTDYWPRAPHPLRDQVFDERMKNSNNIIHFIPKGNGIFHFKNKNNMKNLELPFIYYDGSNYSVYLNNKPVHFYPNKHQLITINNVKRGNNYVHIHVNLDKTLIVSRCLTFMSMFIYLILFLKNKKLRK